MTISITLPYLPPMALSKNSRCHWREKHREFQKVKWDSGWLLAAALRESGMTGMFDKAEMHIDWRYRLGRPADSDNIVARVAAIRDAAEAVGLVADDKDVSIGTITTTRVKRGEESVVVTFVPLEATP